MKHYRRDEIEKFVFARREIDELLIHLVNFIDQNDYDEFLINEYEDIIEEHPELEPVD